MIVFASLFLLFLTPGKDTDASWSVRRVFWPNDLKDWTGFV
jgi:hypothetical protein